MPSTFTFFTNIVSNLLSIDTSSLERGLPHPIEGQDFVSKLYIFGCDSSVIVYTYM